MAGRVTQVVEESVLLPTNATARVTQIAVEQVVPGALYGTPANPTGRVTQICIEVIHANVGSRPFWQPTAIGHCVHCGAIGGLM